MTTTPEPISDVTVLSFSIDLVADNRRAIGQAVADAVVPGVRLVLDLSHVGHVDSYGLGVLIACVKGVRRAGGDVKLCGLTRRVRVLAELVRLHHLLDILNTRDEAVRAYQV